MSAVIEKDLALIVHFIERHPGIFHGGNGAGDVDGHRPGIGVPALREVLDRILEVLCGTPPVVRTRTFNRIDRHRQRGLVIRQVDPRRIPDERPRRRKRHIAGVQHPEVPGQLAIALRSAGGIVQRLSCANDHGRVRVASPLQLRALRSGQDFLWIHQLPGAYHQHLRRHGNVVVEVAILQIELGANVGQRVPAAQVIEHRHARIPLCDIEDLTVF